MICHYCNKEIEDNYSICCNKRKDWIFQDRLKRRELTRLHQIHCLEDQRLNLTEDLEAATSEDQKIFLSRCLESNRLKMDRRLKA